jgi:GT2 family glycosyltransferase
LNKLPFPKKPKKPYDISDPGIAPVLRLSIVIPVLGDQKPLDDTLLSVLENRPANCELLVVHNQPYSDPYELAGEVQFIEAPRSAGFAECVNLGVSACRAPVVHVLACGVEVRAGWANAALRHFRDPEVASVAPLIVHRDNDRAVVSAGLGYRAEGVAWRLAEGRTPDQVGESPEELCGPDALAAFYRRSAVESVGRFSPSAIDVLAATDMALSLRQAGFRCIVEPKSLGQVDAAMVRSRPSFRHGCNTERLFWRWASAHGRVQSLAAHAALVAGECVIGLWRPSMLMQLAGRAVGAIGAAIARQRHQSRFSESDGPTVLTMTRSTTSEPEQEQSSVRAA